VRLDDAGGERARLELELAGPDATIAQIVPMLVEAEPDDDDSDPFERVAVVLLERHVKRLGREAELSRVSVRRLAGRATAIQIVAEGPDDGTGTAPAAIVGAGAHTTARLPAVLWRRAPQERTGVERRGAPSILSILRGATTSDSDFLGDTRTATAAAWRGDGTVIVAASDAGRPLVITPASEHIVDVPTPATLSSLLVPEKGNVEWVAAGLDGCRRLFVVATTIHSSPTRSFFLPVAPLVDAPPDLADVGAVLGLPLLLPRSTGVSLVWPARVGGVDQLRVRELTDGGAAAAPSAHLLSCPDGAKALAADAVELRGGVVTVMSCAQGGRADVRGATWRVEP
jgi:hypothetical protein